MEGNKPTGGAAHRTKGQREADRTRAAELWVKGWTLRQIAAELGRALKTAAEDVAAVRKEWAEARVNDIDELKAIQLQKLDNLERTYWEGWERSLQQREETTTERQAIEVAVKDVKSARVPAEKLKAVVKTTQGEGNSRFLDGVRETIALRCDLLSIKRTQVEADVALTWVDRARAERGKA